MITKQTRVQSVGIALSKDKSRQNPIFFETTPRCLVFLKDIKEETKRVLCMNLNLGPMGGILGIFPEGSGLKPQQRDTEDCM